MVVIFVSVNRLTGTSTLRYGDASPWSYFVSDSWAPPPYAAGMRPRGCTSFLVSDSVVSWVPTPYAAGMRLRGRISFLVYRSINSWARTPISYTDSPSYLALVKSSPRFVSQGHLHPLISVVSSRHPNPSRNSFPHGTSVHAYQPWPRTSQPPSHMGKRTSARRTRHWRLNPSPNLPLSNERTVASICRRVPHHHSAQRLPPLPPLRPQPPD